MEENCVKFVQDSSTPCTYDRNSSFVMAVRATAVDVRSKCKEAGSREYKAAVDWLLPPKLPVLFLDSQSEMSFLRVNVHM